MAGIPTFRHVPDSEELLLSPSDVAKSAAESSKSSSQGWVPKSSDQVRKEALFRVRAARGDVDDNQLVLSRYSIQFGKYRGQTFLWLLENDVGYVVSVVASHIKERQTVTTDSLFMSNKDSLKEYACSFPRVSAAVNLRKLQNEAREKAAEPGQEDLRLLGFGQHRELTWRELYEAEDKEKKGYVKWIKRQTPRPGTQMEAFREYVLRRDAKSQLGSKAPTAAAERQPSSSGPAEVTDEELLNVEEPSAVVPSCSFSPIPFYRGWTHSSTGPKIPPTPAVKKTPPTPAVKKTPPTPAVKKTPPTPAVKKTPPTPAVKKTPPTPAATTTPLTPAATTTPLTPAATTTPLTPAATTTLPTPAGTTTPPTPAVTSGSLPVLTPQALQQESQMLMPESWKQCLPPEQLAWINKALFRRNRFGRRELVPELKLWWYPPQPRLLPLQPPASPDLYFARPLFLWMPYSMWAVKLTCFHEECSNHKLTGAGLYRTVRRVLCVDGWYDMATEYMECRRCKRKYASWSGKLLKQLDSGHRSYFPAILTYRLSCDYSVVRLMRERTLGNSTTQLYQQLREQHSETWMRKCLRYLADCEPFVSSSAVSSPKFAPPPPMPSIPVPKWLLGVYVRDAHSRLDEVKAKVTSTFGSILKMDSTKKIVKKLAGEAAGTAAWATNVGNEHGQVLTTVLTSHEGTGLVDMASGLMKRYRDAMEPPPRVIYVDRDCCSLTGSSSVAKLFHEWEDVTVVRLDVWHLMRRFASAVTTESHQLYGAFMSGLSGCIFEWDASDVSRLREAKRSELEGKRHLFGLSDDQVELRITKKELAKHCRRRTRGAEETTRLIRQLIDTFKGHKGSDTMGIPLLDRGRIEAVWQSQKRHLVCIQDPDEEQLYTKVGQLVKGGVTLPVYRCARGSTSLESFHLHLNNFIPGTSANAMHLQVYLLEGLVRWNENRAIAAVQGDKEQLHSYSSSLQHALNSLSLKVLGTSTLQDHTRPGAYTGELIGVEYLYAQTGSPLPSISDDPDVPEDLLDELEPDEGFGEDAEAEDPTLGELSATRQSCLPEVAAAAASRSGLKRKKDSDESSEGSQGEAPPLQEGELSPTSVSPPHTGEASHGPDGAPGYEHVVNLATALVGLRKLTHLTDSKVDELVSLWELLPDSDKERSVYPPRHQDRLTAGRFKATKYTSGTPGVESLKRCLLGENAGPAQWPDASRVVEAVCRQLCDLHPSSLQTKGVRVERWALILRNYHSIRQLVLNTPMLMSRTTLQLFEINRRTLMQWFNKRQKYQERAVLLQGVERPSASAVAQGPLPPPREQLVQPPTFAFQPFTFASPPNTAGQAVRRHQKTEMPQLPQAPRARLILPAASATQTQPVCVFISPAPSSHIPVPVLQPVQHTVQPPTAVTGAAAQVERVPATTAWYRKKTEGTQRRKYERSSEANLCSKCGQPKRKEFGHSRFGSETFCAANSSLTVDQWLAQMREKHKK